MPNINFLQRFNCLLFMFNPFDFNTNFVQIPTPLATILMGLSDQISLHLARGTYSLTFIYKIADLWPFKSRKYFSTRHIMNFRSESMVQGAIWHQPTLRCNSVRRRCGIVGAKSTPLFCQLPTARESP